MSNATEQWAQFAIAGPRSRDLLNTVLETPIDDAFLPVMSCDEFSVSGVMGRVFRVSFSGEHGYEVAVPASYGESLFRLLLAQAETIGGGPYGMEAMNVLRIEKGFLTHAEMHGRTTAFDLGRDSVIDTDKDCVGQAAAQRPGLKDPARERLVGLRALGDDGLLAGAHLFAAGEKPTAAASQGYVTSACYSPTLLRHIGLGFLTHGPERIGETLTMVDHLRGVKTQVEVCAPEFFDPEGVRQRG